MEYGYKGVCDLKAFVVLTETGRTVEYLSRMRPRLPIIALSGSVSTLDQLQLSFGVTPAHFDFSKVKGVDLNAVISTVLDTDLVEENDKVVMIYGEVWGEPGLTSVVRVQEIVTQ